MPEVLADSVVAVRDSLMVTERIGIRPTVAVDSPEVMPVVSPISSNRCSGIGAGDKVLPDSVDRTLMRSLHLSLRDAAQTHKQILTVNGKQVRITIPAGVADGQVIKLKGYGA